jgi:glycosyltransferase involved in cell wall biosynthesis
VEKVLPVSYTLKEYLINGGFDSRKVVVLYNIVTRTNNLGEEVEEKLKKTINYSDEDFLIGMIGNFVTEKDQLTLSRAFYKLLSHNSKAKLVFIGEISKLTQKAKDVFPNTEIGSRVYFTGQIANASELIPLFDLMVFSSNSETFGMAAMESLLHKVPVIASDIPVMRELSFNGKYFQLFPRGDDKILSDMLREHVEGMNDTRYDLNESMTYVKNEFSASKYITTLESIYSDDCD